MTEQISFDYLKQMAEGEEEVIQEMTSLFKGQVPDLIQKMERARKDKDYKSLREVAHRAKSSVAIMGMNNLAEQMKQLELDAENQTNTDSYADKIANFKSTCNQAVNDLNSMGY